MGSRKERDNEVSCPFAGMTRIRFEGSPRISGLSAPRRGSPGNALNVVRPAAVSTTWRLPGSLVWTASPDFHILPASGRATMRILKGQRHFQG